MSVRVLKPGLHTTVQDLGRAGHQHEGVPVSGAMDAPALRVANLLVGNDHDAAGLEVTLLGPTLLLENEVLFAITGADLSATLDGEPVLRGCAVHARAGAQLAFGAAAAGCRAYVAFAGGIDVPRVLGSRATYVRGGLGGVQGRALRAGDLLPLGVCGERSVRTAATIAPGASARWGVSAYTEPAVIARAAAEIEVRALRGRHVGRLTAESRRALFGEAFTVGAASDRMGYRLEGSVLELRRAVEPVSEAVSFGTVQLPPGGAPIILMADRQTTGGYPRLLEVASVDLPRLAQAAPGTRLRFREISLEAAQRLYLARERQLAQLALGLALRAG